MFDRFTEPARQVVIGAQAQARALGHPYIGTHHILLALLDPASGVPAAVLGAVIDRDRVLAEIELHCGARPAGLDERDAEALRTIGIDLSAVVAAVESAFGPGALEPAPAPPRRRRWRIRWRIRPRERRRQQQLRQMGGQGKHLPFAARCKIVLELALRESLRLRQDRLGSEHILLGLLREGEGLAARILVEAGLTLEDLRGRTLRALDDAA
jgi:ATP-dependent Clp protease ATP-binding subunit ClpA